MYNHTLLINGYLEKSKSGKQGIKAVAAINLLVSRSAYKKKVFWKGQVAFLISPRRIAGPNEHENFYGVGIS